LLARVESPARQLAREALAPDLERQARGRGVERSTCPSAGVLAALGARCTCASSRARSRAAAARRAHDRDLDDQTSS
jgi:hypothetical protein